MKKALLLLSFLIPFLNARASHLMGGDITVYPDSANDSFYWFKVVHYRDVHGVPANYAVTGYLHRWDAASNSWMQITQPLLTLDSAHSGTNLPNFPYGVEVYTYLNMYRAPLQLWPGRYRLDVTECCRNIAILNAAAPDSEHMTLTATFEVVPPAANTSPQFLALPIVYLPVNQPWTYNPLPYDTDGDSISWAMTVPNGGVNTSNYITVLPIAGYTTPPAAASGPFTLNPVTGEVTWTANTTGHFVTSFAITEYRNGQPAGSINRDMQYVVVTDSVPLPSFALVTPVVHNAAGHYDYRKYDPGQPMLFRIRGVDTSNRDLTLTCYSGLFLHSGAPTFSSAPTGTGNTVEGTFTWTPPATQLKDELVIFRVSNGVFARDYTLVLRKNATAGVGTAVPAPSVILSAYPNPAMHRLNVSLQIDAPARVGLQLTDITGRVVQRLSGDPLRLPKGRWQLGFDLRCGSGVYMLQAVSGGAVVAAQQITVLQ